MIAAALDALSHALESLWVRRSTRFTGALALAAAASLREALPSALSGDGDARQRLIESSAMANLACGNSGLTLVHALSTAPSVHVPHGLKNGILLPYVARFNEEVSAPATRSLIAQIGPLYRTLGFRQRLHPTLRVRLYRPGYVTVEVMPWRWPLARL